MVPDRGILVLGGLIDEDVREVVERVPGVGRLPILGNLFKYRNSERIKRNLMVFIRPHILSDIASQNAVTGGKYRHMRNQQIKAREEYDGLLPTNDLPLLPDLDQYREQHENAAEAQPE